MTTLEEVKEAVAKLSRRDRAVLMAELIAMEETELDAALDRGLKDVEEGRVRAVEEVMEMIPGWAHKD